MSSRFFNGYLGVAVILLVVAVHSSLGVAATPPPDICNVPLGKSAVEVGWDHLTSGKAMLAEAEYSGARMSLTKALACFESDFDHNQQAVAEVLDALEDVMIFEGRYQEAEKNARRSLAIRRKLYPEAEYPDGHEEIVSALNQLAEALFYVDKSAAAKSISEEAVRLSRRLFGPNDPRLADSLEMLAEILRALAQPGEKEGYEEGVRLLAEALQIRQHQHDQTGGAA